MKILIDSGHTQGYNEGITDGYYEGNAMFTLSQYMKQELEQYEGIEVFLTRENVTNNPSLESRGQKATEVQADVFISLHSNAFSDSSASGVVGFYSTKLPQSKARCDKLLQTIATTMGNNNRGSQVKTGTNGDYYSVIRNSVKAGTVQASYLIEHGFHTNRKECDWLSDDDNLRALAKAEAETIATHFSITKTPTTLYRVQIGAYSDRSNAERMLNEINKKGYKAFISY